MTLPIESIDDSTLDTTVEGVPLESLDLDNLDQVFPTARFSNRKQTISEEANTYSKPRSDISPSPFNNVEEILQEWCGIVLSVRDGKEVVARISDITNSSAPDEIISLDIDEFDTHDIPDLVEGASFYWHIGYRYGEKRPREKFSKLRLRKLPRWSKHEIEEASRIVDKYVAQLRKD